jgi:hypothetical protein
MYQYDSIADDEFKSIKRLTGSLGHKNRGPRHKLDVQFHTSLFPFNFWTNVAPGDRFNFQYDFGFHKVSADYLLLGYTATINEQGDELVVPDMQRISPYTA